MSTGGLPLVTVRSLGGTISCTGDARQGVSPTLGAQDLVEAVPELAAVAVVEASSLRQAPSSELSLSDLGELAEQLEADAARGAAGMVVTQGTDTIEEVAFVLDAIVGGDAPVVVTGAMRHPALPGADGPANLLAAVQVAADPASRGLGCVVVANDEVHSARFVRKTHTASPATFRSPGLGPLGWVSEGAVRIALRPAPRRPPLPRPASDPPVALVTASLGDDGRVLDCLPELGYAGVVVEAMGGGHVPVAMAERLGALAASIPVVLASRAGSGEVLRRTYAFPGSEIDLMGRGLLPAGDLDGLKARLLLSLLLAAGVPRGELAGEVAARSACGGGS